MVSLELFSPGPSNLKRNGNGTADPVAKRTLFGYTGSWLDNRPAPWIVAVARGSNFGIESPHQPVSFRRVIWSQDLKKQVCSYLAVCRSLALIRISSGDGQRLYYNSSRYTSLFKSHDCLISLEPPNGQSAARPKQSDTANPLAHCSLLPSERTGSR